MSNHNILYNIAATLAAKRNQKPKKSGNGYMTICPSHDDSTASLSLSHDNGKILWHCQAGCDQNMVEEHIRPLLPEDTAKSNGKQIAKIYSYPNTEGKIVIDKVRFAPKGFALRRTDGNDGFIYKDATAGVDTSILYRLPELNQSIANGDTIHIPEGEKDADNLWAIRLPATCNMFGASEDGKKPKWTDKNTAWLKGAKQIVIHADNDSAGEAHVLAIAKSATKAGIPCKIIRYPELPPKGDISDWLQIPSNDKEKLLERIEQCEHFSGGTGGTSETGVESQALSEKPAMVPATPDEGTSETGGTKTYPYFDVRDDGTYCIELVAKKTDNSIIQEENEIKLCSKLEILAATRDANNENWGRLLSFKDPEEYEHKWPMPMALLAGSGDEYRTELLRNGLLIEPGANPRKLLTTYIQTQKIQKYVRCVSRSGWQGSQFVLPDGTICGESNEEILLQTDSPIDHGIASRGTQESWRNTIGEYCKGNSRMIGMVSAGFAAPLLEILDLEGFIANLKGPSSKGKTTCQRTPASIYGSPKYIKTWHSTKNGIEALAAAHNNLPLPLDEQRQADPREIGEAVYMLGNGISKQRANKFGGGRSLKQFNTLVLSTSEQSLSVYLAAANIKVSPGMTVRCIDIPAIAGDNGVFENLHNFANGALFATAIKWACAENYGAVRKEYLSRVAAERESLPIQFRTFKDNFETSLKLPKNASGQILRVAEKFAVIAFGGELATCYGFTGWSQGDATTAAATLFQGWLDERGGNDEQERINLLSQVRLFFEQHVSRFEKWEGENRLFVNNRAGLYKDIAGETEFYVFPETFRQELIEGYEHKFATEILRNERLLIPDAEKKSTTSVRLPGGKKVRMYVFKNVYSEEPTHE